MSTPIQNRQLEIWKKISSLPVKDNTRYVDYSISSWGNGFTYRYDVKTKIDSYNRKIVQLNLDSSYVKTYDKIDMVTADGFSRRCISKCCRKLIRQSGGYKWMYKDEYNNSIEDDNENN